MKALKVLGAIFGTLVLLFILASFAGPHIQTKASGLVPCGANPTKAQVAACHAAIANANHEAYADHVDKAAELETK